MNASLTDIAHGHLAERYK